jgi:hypothetical protein
VAQKGSRHFCATPGASPRARSRFGLRRLLDRLLPLVTGAGEMTALWLGPFSQEALSAFHRALEHGLSHGRALVVGQVASFQDCWTFRASIAKRLKISVRTVQRALTEAQDLGLIGKARCKPGEIPHGLQTPVECGWSHRWTVGWGQAAERAKAAIAQARLSRLVRKMMAQPTPPPRRDAEQAARAQVSREQSSRERWQTAPRRWTAEELDRELAAREAQAPPAPPDTPS